MTLNTSFIPYFAPCLLGCVGILSSALGQDLPAPQRASSGEAAPATVIESDYLELESGAERNLFIFRDNVTVFGNNLVVSCDYMEVIAAREDAGSADPDATMGKIGAIEKITAVGNVIILQEGRKAYAGRAEVIPAEEKVVLLDGPRVVDAGIVVTGCRMLLLKSERRAQVLPCEGEGAGPNVSRQRPTVTLAPLEDLGYEERNSDATGPQWGDRRPSAPSQSPAPGEAGPNGGGSEGVDKDGRPAGIY